MRRPRDSRGFCGQKNSLQKPVKDGIVFKGDCRQGGRAALLRLYLFCCGGTFGIGCSYYFIRDMFLRESVLEANGNIH